MQSTTGGPLTPQQFVAKWTQVELSERAASQEHFIDLCRMLGQPTPADHDATGAEYAFEKGVVPIGSASKSSKGEAGFADVWWRGKFAWEYKPKGKYKDFGEAYHQLLQYREALENPPLLNRRRYAIRSLSLNNPEHLAMAVLAEQEVVLLLTNSRSLQK